jgi:hypothetical protein
VDIQKYIADVKSIDWNKYKYRAYNSPQNVCDTLVSLAIAENEEENRKGDVLLAPAVYNDVLSAIGNNHAGTYYPVALEALPFILKVALYGNHEISRNCAINILNELFFFTSEDGDLELDKRIKIEIANHKENFIELSHVDEKNSELLNDFVECINEVQNENGPFFSEVK